MKRSLFALAAIACLAFAHFVIAPFVEIATAAGRWLKVVTLDALKLAAGDGVGFARPLIARVKAKAFILRLAKRQRPELSGSWRMCPST